MKLIPKTADAINFNDGSRIAKDHPAFEQVRRYMNRHSILMEFLNRAKIQGVGAIDVIKTSNKLDAARDGA